MAALEGGSRAVASPYSSCAVKVAVAGPASYLLERVVQGSAAGTCAKDWKNRPGAAHKLNARDVRVMIRHLSKSVENRQSTWQDLARLYGRGCHPDTVKRTLNAVGYYKRKACQMSWLTDDNVTERLAFAKAYRNKTTAFWRSVRFTDEVHFSMESRAAAWVIRDDTERYHPETDFRRRE